MKKIIIFLVLPFTLLAQNKKSTTTIKKTNSGATLQIIGNITGLLDNTAIKLLQADGSNKELATTVAVKNKFTINQKLVNEGVYLLVMQQGATTIPIFVGNEKLTITGDINNVSQLVYKGSASQNDFLDYTKMMQPLMLESNAINQLAAGPQGPTDSLKQAFEIVKNKILAQADVFLQTKSNSSISPLLLLIIKNYSPSETYIQQRFDKLGNLAKQSFYGKLLYQNLTAKAPEDTNNQIGSMAANFSQADVDGKPISLSSFKGKYVLIDFWASWCRPCRDENPNVVTNYNKFKNKNFTVLGVSLDRAKEPWLQAIAADNLTWTHVSDLKFWSNEVAVQYGISSIPQNILVGPDGKIVAKNLRGADLQNKLCEILGCN
jgi:peroxiredoxin